MDEQPPSTEQSPRLTISARLNPATEKLMEKIIYLEEALKEIPDPDQDQGQKKKQKQKNLINVCQTYIQKARGYLDRPFYKSRHTHLVWELLHRVDEYLILLMTDEELYSRAIDVKTSFNLNIKEEKIREVWIGEKGKLIEAIENIQKEPGAGGGGDRTRDRYVVKEALNLINEQMDRTFWQLSSNTLTSVWSGMILGALILFSWACYSFFAESAHFSSKGALFTLDEGGLSKHFLTLFVLGLMGAYLSNLMTKEDFLYLRGGPYWRYLLHNLMSKPVMSGFAAILIYLLAKTELIFSIGSGSAGSTIININVKEGFVGYAYAILAIVSGFAADKILRSMIDDVLKKLEQKAEKNNDSVEK